MTLRNKLADVPETRDCKTSMEWQGQARKWYLSPSTGRGKERERENEIKLFARGEFMNIICHFGAITLVR